MTREEQIATIQARIAEVESSIAQMEAAIPGASEDDRRTLEARIAELQQTLATLRTMLNNLQGAAIVASLPAGARRRTLTAHNREAVKSAKRNARDVHQRANAMIAVFEPIIKSSGTGKPKKQPSRRGK